MRGRWGVVPRQVDTHCLHRCLPLDGEPVALLTSVEAAVRLQDDHVEASPLKPGDRITVYWTDDRAWYPGTFKTSRIESADDGGRQRTSCVLYDAVGQWQHAAKKELTYWHCLDDEQWNFME